MAEGIEIIIDPKKLIPHIIYIVIIIILAVLLIIKWNSGSCDAEKKTADTSALAAAGAGQANQTANITNTTQAADTCSNEVKDSTESDIDCGGSCNGCAENKMCNADNDCASGLFCYQGIKCKQPSCTDGVKNQDETNIDCGGTCSGFWWSSDSNCHATAEPSGKLSVTLSPAVGKSELSGNAVLNSLTMTLDNGLSRPLMLTAYIYAMDANGKSVFSDQEGNKIAIDTVTLDTVPAGEKLTKTVNFVNNTRRTLVGVKSTDAYQLLVEFKDPENELVERKTWTNS